MRYPSVLHSGWPFLAVCALLMAAAAPAEAEEPDVAERARLALDAPLSPHPRLFFSDEDIDAIRQQIESDPLLASTWAVLQEQSDAMLDLEPVERDQVGRRLLGVSRTVLKRVSYLAFTYRLTGEQAYLRRAEEEMLAAAAFTDWNPSHFLDVAEMTAALAIGYDWLHDGLSAGSRETIREAIVDKGLQTSFDQAGGWVRGSNNWTQVCHGGLTMGALAVIDHEPALAEDVIVRAVENIHRPMDVYGPNGGYPEGPGYWLYGTSYNVLFIEALDSALGEDFGLSRHERFMDSARYYLHMHGSTTGYFNYSDNSESSAVSAAMYWFARRLEEPELLWMERRKLARLVEDPPSASGGGNRLFPFLLVWARAFHDIDPPEQLHYADDGETPVGAHRTGWEEDAVYVGLKAGTPRAAHGQLDIGAFVMEADGVRWAIDLGRQGYHSLEEQGIDLWNRAQDSERWTVFRLNNHSKNTLVVNDELQRVDGFAPITAFADDGAMPHTVIDMSEVYAGQLAITKRGVGLMGGGGVVVQDEMQAPDEPATVRWGMLTRADVELIDDAHAILRQDGEELGMHILEGEGPAFEIYETETPPRDYDAPNPGTQMIGFTVDLEPGEEQRFTVLLNPGGTAEEQPAVTPLDEW